MKTTNLTINVCLLANKTNKFYSTISIKENKLYPGLEPRQSIATVPNVNDIRNNKRFANAKHALSAYIQTQTTLNDSVLIALSDLANHLDKVYHKDPYNFVRECKTLGNWFKVNVFAKVRTQGLVPNLAWNKLALVPRILAPIFVALAEAKSFNDKLIIIRITLSIFDLYQVIVTPVAPSGNTITAVGKDTSQVISKEEVDKAIELLGLNTDELTENFKFSNIGRSFHSSSASGPNGQAVWNSHLDAKAIIADKEVYNNFTAICELLERKDLLTVLTDAAQLPNLIDSDESQPKHSKLHVLFEKGDKARVIAILDYFTQEVLSPFHDTIAEILKGIEQDGTFNQNKIAEMVRVFTQDSKLPLFSLDLTAATDRLPVVLQRLIISRLIKIEGFSFLWQKLLTFRTFITDTGVEVRYSVGQPMGAKSSFPMLGLTHHIIVQIAAQRAGLLTRFTNYVILGDDIMIADHKVATCYLQLMKDLGLDISDYKSIISTPTTVEYPIAEICRRVFVLGHEITPIPMKLLANVFENGSLALQLQTKMTERSLFYIENLVPNFFQVFNLGQQGFDYLGLVNSLPSWMSKLVQKFDYGTRNDANFLDMEREGLTEDILLEFYKFTVITEQFKRLSTLIQAADTGFKAISKSINLGDILFVEGPDDKKVSANRFTLETLLSWNLLGKTHPARFVMLSEINRVSGIMRTLASIRGKELFLQLLENVIDNLKYSILEVIRDRDIKAAQFNKSMIDKTFDNIKKCRDSQNQTLSFSVKIEEIGVVWIIKLGLYGTCNLTSHTINSPSTLKDTTRTLQIQQRNSGKPFSLFKNET